LRPEVREIQQLMEAEAYVTDAPVATAVHLATSLGKPLLVEGPPGVGKTEIAKVLARTRETELIRLQCYEGLDAAHALYEWNYPKQMLRIRLEEGSERSVEEREASIFSREFLLERPLLRAITHDGPAPVLLIDEVDRADEEFEAFLLEVLSDFQVTIPEIGTVEADPRPHVVLTSNRSRDLSEALRRRCLYLWIDYPGLEKELEILRARVPELNRRLAGEVAHVVQEIRELSLAKAPGVSETLDWARALVALHAEHLEPSLVRETLGCLAKEERDLRRLRELLDEGRFDALVGAGG